MSPHHQGVKPDDDGEPQTNDPDEQTFGLIGPGSGGKRIAIAAILAMVRTLHRETSPVALMVTKR